MDKIIRVLHYGMSTNLGGIETFIMNIYRKIDRSKIQFDFLTFCDDIVFVDEIKKLGGRIYRLTSRKKNFIKNYIEIKKFFKEHDEYSIIHYHLNTCSYILPLKIISKNPKYRIIAHSHNEWKGNKKITKFFHILNKPEILQVSNYRFACSEMAGEYMFGNNVKYDANFKIIPNAIDAKKFMYNSEVRKVKRQELGIKNEFVIGHIGKFTYQKHHEFLVDIFNEVYKRNNETRLILVGDGELKSQIYTKIKRLELENVVKILGIRNDVNELMNAFDIFLLPSYFEGIPIVALEAQASGLRTIVSDVVSREIKITDLVEFISLQNDAEHWAEKVLKYQNRYKRKNMLEVISNANYDISNNVRWLENFYTNEKL